MSRLGEAIMDARIKAGLNQTDFGASVGVTPQAVSQWEKGITTPAVEILFRLREIYRVDLNAVADELSDFSGQLESPTLRDQFAMQALNGIIPDCGLSAKEMAERCFEAADAMMAHRAIPSQRVAA